MKKMAEDESEVKLKYIGGPEVTPNRKQGAAMKRGLIDIIMSPTTYYSNLQPEAKLTGISNVPPKEWRKNGGYEIMADAWAKRMNAIILGWGNFYTTEQFSIWLVDEPKLSKKTGIDLVGKKMRSTALYTPFYKEMGAIRRPSRRARSIPLSSAASCRAWPGRRAASPSAAGSDTSSTGSSRDSSARRPWRR